MLVHFLHLREEEVAILDISTFLPKPSCLLWVPERSITLSLQVSCISSSLLKLFSRTINVFSLSAPKNPFLEYIPHFLPHDCHLLSPCSHVSVTFHPHYNTAFPGLIIVNKKLGWMKRPGTHSTWKNMFYRNRRESVPLGYVTRPKTFTGLDIGQCSGSLSCGTQLLMTVSVEERGSY